jgi:DNA-binding Lrp family transcriptional regulator
MRRTGDKISQRIVEILEKIDEPLETREIELILKDVSRIKVLYRLNNLRGDGMIKGKPVGSGKGAWIWWRKNVF